MMGVFGTVPEKIAFPVLDSWGGGGHVPSLEVFPHINMDEAPL